MNPEKLGMLGFDLGKESFPVSTQSAEAQRYFDQGLNWCFAFNQEEGLACFQKGCEVDPACAMMHWGIAYAAGPFYNMAWEDFSLAEASECTAFCRGHIDKALNLLEGAQPMERALIEALSNRVQQPVAVPQDQFDRWDDAYADAMRRVNRNFPDQIVVMALFIEAMMTRTPWKMWNVQTNRPPDGADTLEAIEVCERAIALADERGRGPASGDFASSHSPSGDVRSSGRSVVICSDIGATLPRCRASSPYAWTYLCSDQRL